MFAFFCNLWKYEWQIKKVGTMLCEGFFIRWIPYYVGINPSITMKKIGNMICPCFSVHWLNGFGGMVPKICHILNYNWDMKCITVNFKMIFPPNPHPSPITNKKSSTWWFLMKIAFCSSNSQHLGKWMLFSFII